MTKLNNIKLAGILSPCQMSAIKGGADITSGH